jgi:hypothetical protein
MDIEHYIASGTLDAYALGQASEQEQREVHCLSAIYPEIKEALSQIEQDAERFAMAYAKKVPDNFREKVLAEVRKHEQVPSMKVVSSTTTTTSTRDSRQNPRANETLEKDEKFVASTIKSAFPRLWAVAAVGLLLLGVWQFFQIQQLGSDLRLAQDSAAATAGQLAERDARLDGLNTTLNAMVDPAVKKVLLSSVREGSDVSVSLFWNSKTGEVNLDLSALPALAAEQQYQLWVLKDGQPIDMGVLPKNSEALMAASKNTLDGDAFAITIEPLGGRPSPSLDQLVVMGNIG